ncbi:hypothetical protein GCM10010191_77530 [Actinomadura vinacea]|uniref:MFS transporter n=1 Tax=Actinomadura vinacea TaxID=115336 RepID=A0ABN3K3N6_9ACTN
MSHRSSCRSAAAATGTALLALTAPPAAALVLPDLSPGVMDAARASLGEGPAFVRAAGVTLPALLLAVPSAAGLARRSSPRLVLAAGLLLLLAGLAGAQYANSVPAVAAARLAQGAGAGFMLPASLVLVWERRSRFLVAFWAGTLAAGLLGAMPLALYMLEEGGWRDALAPFPWFAVAAAAAALIVGLAEGRRGVRAEPLPAPRSAERGQLVLPVAPAAGLAFLAVATTHDWSPGARLVVAGIALVALFGLAVVAGRDATAGSPLGCAVVMVTAGLLAYPLAGPLAGLAAGGAVDGATGGAAQGAGGVPTVPFAAGGTAALAGALLTVRLPERAVRAAVTGGHGLIVVAVVVALATPAAGDPRLLAAVLVPLGLGVGAALAASLRDAGPSAALFGLGLCFPAVLTGQLLVLSLQAGRWYHARPETAAQRLAALTDGYRAWLVAAGVIALVLALAARRRRGGGEAVPEPGGG